MKKYEQIIFALIVVLLYDNQRSRIQTEKIEWLDKQRAQDEQIVELQETVEDLRGDQFDRLLGEEEELASRQALAEILSKTRIDLFDFPDIQRLMKSAVGVDIPLFVAERTRVLRSIPDTLPAQGWVSSLFGIKRVYSKNPRREIDHKGLDVSNLIGTPIYAPADGMVRFAGRNGSFGNYLSVTHGFGIVTKYGHLHKLKVRSGEAVKRGQLIALMGNSGQSRGTHLHYEVWVNDKPRDPAGFSPNFEYRPRMLVTRGFSD